MAAARAMIPAIVAAVVLLRRRRRRRAKLAALRTTHARLQLAIDITNHRRANVLVGIRCSSVGLAGTEKES